MSDEKLYECIICRKQLLRIDTFRKHQDKCVKDNFETFVIAKLQQLETKFDSFVDMYEKDRKVIFGRHSKIEANNEHSSIPFPAYNKNIAMSLANKIYDIIGLGNNYDALLMIELFIRPLGNLANIKIVNKHKSIFKYLTENNEWVRDEGGKQIIKMMYVHLKVLYNSTFDMLKIENENECKNVKTIGTQERYTKLKILDEKIENASLQIRQINDQSYMNKTIKYFKNYLDEYERGETISLEFPNEDIQIQPEKIVKDSGKKTNEVNTRMKTVKETKGNNLDFNDLVIDLPPHLKEIIEKGKGKDGKVTKEAFDEILPQIQNHIKKTMNIEIKGKNIENRIEVAEKNKPK
jgi:hypothetical protein